MADKTLFARLKKLFAQSTVVRKIGDNKLKVVDPSHAQSTGNLATNMLVDRYNRLHKSQGGAHVYDPNQGLNQLRQELFKDYESMDNDSIKSSELDIYADESTLKNEYGDVLEIKSGKKEIADILHNLFYDVLNIEFNLYPWIRMMCKYGDMYLEAGSRYEGTWLNDEEEGDGKIFGTNRILFKGKFNKGKRHGQGKLYFSKDPYE